MELFHLSQGATLKRLLLRVAYASFFHHFAAVGRQRGYRPLPDPQLPWQWAEDGAE
jgi:hypothetical protein